MFLNGTTIADLIELYICLKQLLARIYETLFSEHNNCVHNNLLVQETGVD